MRRGTIGIVHEGPGGEVVNDVELRGELVQGVGSTDVHRAAVRVDEEPLNGCRCVILIRGSLSRIEYGEDVHDGIPIEGIGRVSIMASRMAMVVVMMMTVTVDVMKVRGGEGGGGKGWRDFKCQFIAIARRIGR